MNITQKEFLMITGMFLVTFGVRYPVLALFSRIKLPGLLERALLYIPPTILTAIIVPAVLLDNDKYLNIDFTNASLIASLAAVLASWRTKNLLVTIGVGMLVLWMWLAIFQI